MQDLGGASSQRNPTGYGVRQTEGQGRAGQGALILFLFIFFQLRKGNRQPPVPVY